MSIFDQMKNRAETAARSAVSNLGNKRETFTFQTLPESVEQMRALPEAAMDTPFKTAALTVCALCAFAADQAVGTDLLNFLRGPPADRAGHLLHQGPFPGRGAQLYHLLLFRRRETGERLYPLPALHRDSQFRCPFL